MPGKLRGMPGPRLWKRYNGIYCVVLPGDRRISLKTRDKDTAQQLFSRYRKSWLQGKIAVLEGAKSIRLAAFKKEYLEARESKAGSTRRNDRTALGHLVAHFGAERTLRSLTVRELEQFKASLLAGPLGVVTVNGYLRHLRTAFNTAIRWEYLLRSPMAQVPFEIEPERESQPVVEEVLAAILGKATEAEGRVFRILLYTGLRPFELCRMTYAHVVDGTIRVRGKRGRVRVVPLMGEAAKLIGEGKPFERVIPWRHPVTLSHKFRKAATAAGYSHVRLYDLRHTFGTVLAVAGVDPFRLSKLMGHTSIKTTQRYVTVTREHLAEAVGRVDGMFGGKKT